MTSCRLAISLTALLLLPAAAHADGWHGPLASAGHPYDGPGGPEDLFDGFFGTPSGSVFVAGVLPGSATFDDGSSYSLGSGFGFGAAIDFPLNRFPGFSVGADISHLSQSFTTMPSDSLAKTSVMGVVKYTMPFSGPLSLYGGVGLGGVNVDEAYSGGGSGTAPGYMVLAGGSYAFSPGLSGFVELRAINTFTAVTTAPGDTVWSGNGMIVGGLSVALPVLLPPPPPPPPPH